MNLIGNLVVAGLIFLGVGYAIGYGIGLDMSVSSVSHWWAGTDRLLTQKARSTDAAVRMGVIDYIQKYETWNSLPIVVQYLLIDTDATIAKKAMDVLVGHSEDAIPALITYGQSSSNPALVEASRKALLAIGSTAIQPLIAVIDNKNQQLRKAAKETLFYFGSLARPDLEETAKNYAGKTISIEADEVVRWIIAGKIPPPPTPVTPTPGSTLPLPPPPFTTGQQTDPNWVNSFTNWFTGNQLQFRPAPRKPLTPCPPPPERASKEDLMRARYARNIAREKSMKADQAVVERIHNGASAYEAGDDLVDARFEKEDLASIAKETWKLSRTGISKEFEYPRDFPYFQEWWYQEAKAKAEQARDVAFRNIRGYDVAWPQRSGGVYVAGYSSGYYAIPYGYQVTSWNYQGTNYGPHRRFPDNSKLVKDSIDTFNQAQTTYEWEVRRTNEFLRVFGGE